MKKSLQIMLAVTLVFIGLIAGVYIGRNSIGTWITLNPGTPDSGSSAEPNQSPTDLGKVNINSANINELCLLPGIGEKKAKSIISFREEFGRFTRPEDLLHVDGFSYTTIEELRPYITVGG